MDQKRKTTKISVLFFVIFKLSMSTNVTKRKKLVITISTDELQTTLFVSNRF